MPPTNVTRDVFSSTEAPLPSGKCYRHAPDRGCVRVPILGLRHHKPSSGPETWRKGWDSEWVTLGCVLVFGRNGMACVFIAVIALWVGWVVLAALEAALVSAVDMVLRKSSVLELDSIGIRLLGMGGFVARVVPYAAIRNVRTYLSVDVGPGGWRGVVLGVDGGRTVTLALGENTDKVVSAIGDKLVALHSHSIGVCDQWR